MTHSARIAFVLYVKGKPDFLSCSQNVRAKLLGGFPLSCLVFLACKTKNFRNCLF